MDNTTLKKLRAVIDGRTVAVMSHGASIYELKKRIRDFAPFDICWTSFNYYPIMEKEILIEIDRKLEIVLECAAGRTKEFETSIRVPRIVHYASKGTFILSTWRLMQTQYEQMGITHLVEPLIERYIYFCDHILGELNVPNSLALLVYSLCMGEPKNIILFGVDGYKKAQGDELSTYFMPEQQKEYRKELLGGNLEYTLHETTTDFERDFNNTLREYCIKLDKQRPMIYNCSPGTQFNKIINLSYDSIINEILKEQ